MGFSRQSHVECLHKIYQRQGTQQLIPATACTNMYRVNHNKAVQFICHTEEQPCTHMYMHSVSEPYVRKMNRNLQVASLASAALCAEV